jgi:hypothetical protein
MYIRILAFIMLVMFTMSTSFAQGDSSKATVKFLVGTAQKKVTAKWSTVNINDQLIESNKVRTGANSIMDIYTDLCKIRLLSNSEFQLNTLANKKNSFKISVGDILVKIFKLKKNESFSLDTPTATLGVRGTQFWGQVKNQGEVGTFAVREGILEITRKSDNQKIIVKQGQALDFSTSTKKLQLRKAAPGELAAMDQIDEMK